MTEKLLNFKNLNWEKPKKGVEQKVYSDGTVKMRLLRFLDNFVEEEWCLKGHIGFVLNGEMKIDFNGEIKNYSKGDGLWINEGPDSKYKVIIEKGKQIEVILYETVNCK